MLPKSKRIQRDVLKGKVTRAFFNSPYLTLRLYRGEPEGKAKFAFSVSKKVASRAVDRNRIRRRGYATLEVLLDRVKNGTLSVFVTKPKILELTFNDLKKEIEIILEKAGCLG